MRRETCLRFSAIDCIFSGTMFISISPGQFCFALLEAPKPDCLTASSPAWSTDVGDIVSNARRRYFGFSFHIFDVDTIMKTFGAFF